MPTPCETVLTWLAACLVAASAVPAHAQVARYEFDPVHTRVAFAVDHAGFSKALGVVSGSSGTLHFDPDDWRSARVEVEVPLSRLDLGDARWNGATTGRALLDVARHPVARFASRTVEPFDEQRARVCGELTLRGITAPLCLDVVMRKLARHPLPPFRRTAGFSATGTLDRSDFGIDAWRSLIGDEVELRIEAEAVRRDADARDATPGTPAPATTTHATEPA